MMRPMRDIRARRSLPAITAGLVLALGAAATASAAEQATFRLTGASPAYPTAVKVTRSDGTVMNLRPSRYNYNVTSQPGSTLGVPAQTSGFCVDTSHYIVSGKDYPVMLMTAADAPEMATANYKEAGWLVAHSAQSIPLAADPQLEAAAHQVAIWALTGQIKDGPAPTSDAKINARVAELRATSAGKSLPESLDVTIAAQSTCIDAKATLTVSGTPGEVVSLKPSDGATVEPAVVQIDATGTASAVVAMPKEGDATVTATADAPRMVRATKPVGLLNPQDQLMVAPGTLTDSVTHHFKDCSYVFSPPVDPIPANVANPPAVFSPVPSPLADPAPVVPSAPTPVPVDVLSLGGNTPVTALPDSTTRYSFTVTNTSRKAARNVVVRQRLQDGLRALSGSDARGGQARVSGNVVTWTVPRLAPGASVQLSSRVSVSAGLEGNLGRADVQVTGLGKASRVRTATPVLEAVTKEDQGF